MDTFLAQILPLLAMPVGLFLVKQFIDQVPTSLVEAAQLDGCSDYGILFRIIMPIVKPALATVAILSFQSAWNSVEASQLFIDQEKLKTFAYYMSAVTSPTSAAVSGQGMAAAAVLILFIPNMILFITMQSKVMNTGCPFRHQIRDGGSRSSTRVCLLPPVISPYPQEAPVSGKE